jgi:hypothetical protein
MDKESCSDVRTETLSDSPLRFHAFPFIKRGLHETLNLMEELCINISVLNVVIYSPALTKLRHARIALNSV